MKFLIFEPSSWRMKHFSKGEFLVVDVAAGAAKEIEAVLSLQSRWRGIDA